MILIGANYRRGSHQGSPSLGPLVLKELSYAAQLARQGTSLTHSSAHNIEWHSSKELHTKVL